MGATCCGVSNKQKHKTPKETGTNGSSKPQASPKKTNEANWCPRSFSEAILEGEISQKRQDNLQNYIDINPRLPPLEQKAHANKRENSTEKKETSQPIKLDLKNALLKTQESPFKQVKFPLFLDSSQFQAE